MNNKAISAAAKEIIDHTKGGKDPCQVCGITKHDHDDAQADRCLYEIYARERRRAVSETLLNMGAIDRATLKENEWTSNPELVLSMATRLPDLFRKDFMAAWLFGDFGTGKSFQAHLLLNKVMKQGKSVMDITGVDLAKRLRQFKDDKLISCAKRCSVLLIDDIDKATYDAKVVDGLWDILNDRSKNRRKTIITANISPVDFFDMISSACGGNTSKAESLVQRLHPTLVLEFRGESFR